MTNDNLTLFDLPPLEDVAVLPTGDYSVRHVCPHCSGSGMIETVVGAKTGADHPETSHRAGRSNTNRIRFGTQRYRVLSVLEAQGSLTAAEIAREIGLSRNQTATRILECREAGLVEYVRSSTGDYETRKTSADSDGRVQTLTELGSRMLTEARLQEASRNG